jgi:broad specificity phosphatase PhoE
MNVRRLVPFLLALLISWSATGATQAPAADGGGPALVILVRHAEKATAPADDPPLTPRGRMRADALAITLRDAGVTSIITSQWLRTRETAAPIASSLRPPLKPESVPTISGDTRAHAEAVAAAVRRHAGEVVLVVGHSNTIPAIITALGGPRLPDICDAAFDDLFILVPQAAAARLVRSRYGAVSPRDGCR